MHFQDDSRGMVPPFSMGELQGLGILARSPGALAFRSTASVRLPAVSEAPSLEGLQVTVPAPAPITPEGVLERYEALSRAVASRRDRAPGEGVALGDDVLLDVIGFVNGRLLPFSARSEWWTEAAPDPLFPGFFESLPGSKVGETLSVEFMLPMDYPVESLRGVVALFAVELKAAREVSPLDEQSPEFFTALRRGATLDEVMEHIAGELAVERDAQAARKCQDEVLREVARRTRIEVPRSLVDEELRRRWSEAEYPVLVRLGIPLEQIPEAFEGWLQDAGMRGDAEHRLRLGLGLRAIATHERLRPVREDAKALFDILADRTRMSHEALGQLLQSNRDVQRRFDSLAMHATAVSHVLSKVRVVEEPTAAAAG
ncbi:peptidylprolyl isomerase [Myxococcus landrumensis]|uniref:Peptidylprolyl isomerase n=1 Tax=Myxococcus landrumensis TaxID=2813577 RepID=A0ABX7N1T6_9BACT|nr:peptidylprolyl isomerase [Myxococcus landrumus]QSQ12671.1 peptidylprolyl isomerase [Myxococcus landrumus]